jgi:hypothetical protein
MVFKIAYNYINNNMSYLYTWYVNKNIYFSYEANDVEKAKIGIIKNIYKLCLEYEKANNYVRFTHLDTNNYYKTLEKTLHQQLCDILCYISSMSITAAHLQIEECYDTRDYSIIHKTFSELFNNHKPVVQI